MLRVNYDKTSSSGTSRASTFYWCGSISGRDFVKKVATVDGDLREALKPLWDELMKKLYQQYMLAASSCQVVDTLSAATPPTNQDADANEMVMQG